MEAVKYQCSAPQRPLSFSWRAYTEGRGFTRVNQHARWICLLTSRQSKQYLAYRHDVVPAHLPQKPVVRVMPSEVGERTAAFVALEVFDVVIFNADQCWRVDQIKTNC